MFLYLSQLEAKLYGVILLQKKKIHKPNGD